MPEPKYVFDTVSISNFAISNSLHILDKIYCGRAFVSSEVYDEILDGISCGHEDLASFPDLLKSRAFAVLPLQGIEYESYKLHLNHLGRGESSSIAIAKHRKMILVSDDKDARNIARESKITLTGTIGILKASTMDNLISIQEADTVLGKMIESGFYSPVNSISQIE